MHTLLGSQYRYVFEHVKFLHGQVQQAADLCEAYPRRVKGLRKIPQVLVCWWLSETAVLQHWSELGEASDVQEPEA